MDDALAAEPSTSLPGSSSPPATLRELATFLFCRDARSPAAPRPPCPRRCKAAALSVWSHRAHFPPLFPSSRSGERARRPAPRRLSLDPATRRLCQAAAAWRPCASALRVPPPRPPTSHHWQRLNRLRGCAEVLVGIAHERSRPAPGRRGRRRFRPHRARALRGGAARRPRGPIRRLPPLEARAECPTAERCAGICGDSDATAPNATAPDAGAPTGGAVVLAVRAALARSRRTAALRWSATSESGCRRRGRCAPEETSKAAQIAQAPDARPDDLANTARVAAALAAEARALGAAATPWRWRGVARVLAALFFGHGDALFFGPPPLMPEAALCSTRCSARRREETQRPRDHFGSLLHPAGTARAPEEGSRRSVRRSSSSRDFSLCCWRRPLRSRTLRRRRRRGTVRAAQRRTAAREGDGDADDAGAFPGRAACVGMLSRAWDDRAAGGDLVGAEAVVFL